MQVGKRRHIVSEDGLEHLGGVVADERPLAAGELVEHDAEREHVGASVDLAASGLFGRGVGERADEDSQAGRQVDRARRFVRSGDARIPPQGHAKVQHLDAAGRRHHHVRGFEVAMHEAVLVGLGQGVGDRLDDVQDPIEIERPEAGQRGDRRALHVLHRDVADAAALVLHFVGFVDDGDVGMIEG